MALIEFMVATLPLPSRQLMESNQPINMSAYQEGVPRGAESECNHVTRIFNESEMPNPAVERDADQAAALRSIRLARRPSLLR